MGRRGLDQSGSGYGQVAGCCEYGTERSDPMKWLGGGILTGLETISLRLLLSFSSSTIEVSVLWNCDRWHTCFVSRLYTTTQYTTSDCRAS